MPEMSERHSIAQKLKIEEEDFNVLKNILQKCVPQYEVRAFGSRVTGTHKPFADLDLVIMAKTPLDIETLGGLMEDLSESPLPFRVDVVDWSTLSLAFQKSIQNANLEIT